MRAPRSPVRTDRRRRAAPTRRQPAHRLRAASGQADPTRRGFFPKRATWILPSCRMPPIKTGAAERTTGARASAIRAIESFSAQQRPGPAVAGHLALHLHRAHVGTIDIAPHVKACGYELALIDRHVAQRHHLTMRRRRSAPRRLEIGSPRWSACRSSRLPYLRRPGAGRGAMASSSPHVETRGGFSSAVAPRQYPPAPAMLSIST